MIETVLWALAGFHLLCLSLAWVAASRAPIGREDQDGFHVEDEDSRRALRAPRGGTRLARDLKDESDA